VTFGKSFIGFIFISDGEIHKFLSIYHLKLGPSAGKEQVDCDLVLIF
jgi:hypothetical protein